MIPKRTLATLALLASACTKTQEPTPSSEVATAHAADPSPPPTAALPSAAAAAQPPRAAGDLAWDVPASWQTVANTSPMRKATYRIPKAPGDDADGEMSVTQVGGGVDANIERWVGQFDPPDGKPKRAERTQGPLKITTVELAGTFNGGGMPGSGASGPKKGQVLLAAIVEGTDPPYFFKLVGPEKSVRAARADFDKLVASMRPR